MVKKIYCFAILMLPFFAVAQQMPRNGDSDQQLIESALMSREHSPPASAFQQKLVNIGKSKRLDTDKQYAEIFRQAKDEAFAKAALLNKLHTMPIPEKDVRIAYEEMKKSYAGKMEYSVSHIIADSQKDAESILAELRKGVNFSNLAKKRSKDGASAAAGGKAGWLTDCMLGCNYTEGLKAQAKEVGYGNLPKRPISSPMGWFVSVVNEIRPLAIPPYKNIKSDLLRKMRMEKMRGEIASLRQER